MFLSKRLSILGAAVAANLFLAAGLASAAPPPGSRWSDHAGTSPSRGRSVSPTPSYRSVGPVSPAPASASTTAAPATIAIRGPDGVVRTYPIAPGASTVRQPGTLSTAPYVTVRGADGVLRTYPVPVPAPSTGTTTAPGTATAPPVYYYYYPCRP